MARSDTLFRPPASGPVGRLIDAGATGLGSHRTNTRTSGTCAQSTTSAHVSTRAGVCLHRAPPQPSTPPPHLFKLRKSPKSIRSLRLL